MALKVGVVGCRGIGTNHAQCHSMDDLADLVAVCDVVKARADELGKKLGVRVYYSLDDMLANEDLDIVDVSTASTCSWRNPSPTTSTKPGRWSGSPGSGTSTWAAT